MSTSVPNRGVLPILLALTLLASGPTAAAGPDDQFSEAPTLNNGQKWRVAYYQGGPYGNYRDTLLGTVRGLIQLGWVQPGDAPEADSEDTESVWRWLAEPGRSEYLEFVQDAYYDAGWDDAKRAEKRTAMLERLSQVKDIDLVLAMGTWAGRDIAAKDEHATPTIVLSTSDAVKAGIIPSVDDSGRDHVHAHVDPNRFGRQITTFHEVVGFKRLGIVFQDTVEGRSYSGIALAQEVAKKRGFQISRCMLRGDFGEEERAEPTVMGCFELLAPHVDAIYVVSQTGLNDRTTPRLVEIVTQARVPTFAQHGPDDVRAGMLMSLSRKNHDSIGLFHASVAARIFNGASPRRLGQIFEEAMHVTFNVDTAEQIGFVPPAKLLTTADIVNATPPATTEVAMESGEDSSSLFTFGPRRAGR